MTPGEFKAWFDGFTEAFDKAPSQKQWARIKERVAEIDGKPVTEKIFIDRYWPGYYNQYIPRPPYWQGYLPYYSGTTGGVGGSSTGGIGSNLNAASQAYQNALQGLGQSGALNNYNSSNAMNALGRSEAQAMS